jgi:hypothetical protein
MVAEDDRPLAQALPRGADAIIGGIKGEGVEAIEVNGGSLHGSSSGHTKPGLIVKVGNSTIR